MISVCATCVDFNNKFKRHSDQRKDAIQLANNKPESREVAELLLYEPIYLHTIPQRSVELGRVNFPSLRIKRRVSWHEAFNLERSKYELNAHWNVAQVQGHEEGVTSSSLRYTSLDTIDSE